MARTNRKHHPLKSLGIQAVSETGIRIELLEDRVNPKVPFPHKHDFYQIILVQSGGGWHQIDLLKYKLCPYQVFIIKPGQTHAWQLSKVKGFVVEFEHSSTGHGKESKEVLNFINASEDCFQLQKNQFHLLGQLSSVMMAEFNDKHFHPLTLRSLLIAFIFLLIKRTGKERLSINRSTVAQFKDELEKHFLQEHDVSFYAKLCGLSPKAFTMQIKRALDKSPRQIIQERLVLEIKRYLIYSEMPIAQIGYELGFNDPNYFSRFFKIHTKSSPADFRKKFAHAPEQVHF